MRILTVLLTAVVACTPLPLFAQAAGTATGGVIWGTVTDETGAALPGATVTAESASLMGKQEAVTNDAGVYRFPSLPPGEFKLTVTLPGRNDNVLLLDLRRGRRFGLAPGVSLSAFVDCYNIANSNAAPTRNTATGNTFLRPLTILPPRVFKFGAKVT